MRKRYWEDKATAAREDHDDMLSANPEVLSGNKRTSTVKISPALTVGGADVRLERSIQQRGQQRGRGNQNQNHFNQSADAKSERERERARSFSPTDISDITSGAYHQSNLDPRALKIARIRASRREEELYGRDHVSSLYPPSGVEYDGNGGVKVRGLFFLLILSV